jgi:hypothetical protein
MTCDVVPHYKLEKINSNFVLKLLFNAWAKKSAAEWVSRWVSEKGIGTGRVGDPSMQYPCETLQKDALTAG